MSETTLETATEPPVIRTQRLTRYFGRRPVVRDLNFAVPRGSVVTVYRPG